MIPHPGRLSILLLFFLTFILALAATTSAGDLLEAGVRNVVDGDTLVLTSNERVRLLGLDAPERGEAFSNTARERLIELTDGRTVVLDACAQRDRYGRKLAVVRSRGLNVNMVLLEEGLAVPMLIPPCGRMVAREVLRAAESALVVRRGIYSQAGYQVVHHEKAKDFIGKRAVICGKVITLHKGKNAWHMNFGENWRTDFTAVLLRQGRSRFEALGMDPEDLVGSEVLVIGKVKRYNGPEIIVTGPEQIIPVE